MKPRARLDQAIATVRSRDDFAGLTTAECWEEMANALGITETSARRMAVRYKVSVNWGPAARRNTLAARAWDRADRPATRAKSAIVDADALLAAIDRIKGRADFAHLSVTDCHAAAAAEVQIKSANSFRRACQFRGVDPNWGDAAKAVSRARQLRFGS